MTDTDSKQTIRRLMRKVEELESMVRAAQIKADRAGDFTFAEDCRRALEGGP